MQDDLIQYEASLQFLAAQHRFGWSLVMSAWLLCQWYESTAAEDGGFMEDRGDEHETVTSGFGSEPRPRKQYRQVTTLTAVAITNIAIIYRICQPRQPNPYRRNAPSSRARV
jgi:hypothetical protein